MITSRNAINQNIALKEAGDEAQELGYLVHNLEVAEGVTGEVRYFINENSQREARLELEVLYLFDVWYKTDIPETERWIMAQRVFDEFSNAADYSGFEDVGISLNPPSCYAHALINDKLKVCVRLVPERLEKIEKLQEGYSLKRPINVSIRPLELGINDVEDPQDIATEDLPENRRPVYSATFGEAKIEARGMHDQDAIKNLGAMIVKAYEELNSCPDYSLSQPLLQKKMVLQELIINNQRILEKSDLDSLF